MQRAASRRHFLRYSALGLALSATSSQWIYGQELKPIPTNLEDGIAALRPGQYLWAPMISPSGPVVSVISLAVQRCYVYRNGVLIGVATISTGRQGHRTPTGVFTVLQKQIHHKSNLYHSAPMPFMERLTWSGVAMHAGNLPGYPASHGCIRLPLAFAKLLYGTTARGMTVVITDLDKVPRVAPTPDLLQGESEMKQDEMGGANWQPGKSSSGPVSLILSAADHRLIVLRDGTLIGSAPVTISGSVDETRAYTLSKVDAQGFHWMELPLPGQSPETSRESPSAGHARVSMPDAFRGALQGELLPGVTLVVTPDSLLAGATGKSLTVLESEP